MANKKITPEEIQFNKEFGKLIRATREKFGMTQKYVANHLGITFQQLQKYEAGKNSLSLYRFYKISGIFETSFESYIQKLNLAPKRS